MLIYVAADAAPASRAYAPCSTGRNAVAGASAGTACSSCGRSPRDGRTLQGDIAPLVRSLSGRRCRACGSVTGDRKSREHA